MRKCGKACFLKKKLMRYRRHGNNVSQMTHYGIGKMIKNRASLLCNYVKYCVTRRK